MKTVWVVVADEAIARILTIPFASAKASVPPPGTELTPVEELTDPTAHASGMDMRRDAEGRRSGGGASSAPSGAGAGGALHGAGRPVNSPTTSASDSQEHRQAAEFAKRVAQHLADGLRAKRYDELRIVAAPRFLGFLRKALAPEVGRVLTDDLAKDLIHMSNAEITERLFPVPEVDG